MSSLTMCQHILNSSENEIVSILEKNEIPGIIVGSTKSGFTIVVEPEESEIIQQETVSISMAYFEDAGFVLEVINKGESVGSIHYMWEADVVFQLSDGFVENMIQQEILSSEKADSLQLILSSVNRESFEPDDIDQFINDITELFGFVGYEYLSYDFLCSHMDDFKEQYPDMKVIDE